MNIFVTSMDPIESAKNLDDQRVVKMIVESAQMLSTSMNVRGLNGPYKTTHKNHPCTAAVTYNYENYKWLLSHFTALLEEYTYRYGKVHKCADYLPIFRAHEPLDINPHMLPYKLSLPNCSLFKDESDLITAYQKTMIEKWNTQKRKPRWTKRNGPTTFEHVPQE